MLTNQIMGYEMDVVARTEDIRNRYKILVQKPKGNIGDISGYNGGENEDYCLL
jgi:hypothetical protein